MSFLLLSVEELVLEDHMVDTVRSPRGNSEQAQEPEENTTPTKEEVTAAIERIMRDHRKTFELLADS